jgi:hypothetical protein
MYFLLKVYSKFPILLLIILFTALPLTPAIVMATEMACQVDSDCQSGHSCRSKPYGGTRCVTRDGLWGSSAIPSHSSNQGIGESKIGVEDLRDSASALDEARRAREEVRRIREEIQQERARTAQERSQAELQRNMEDLRRQNQRMMDESWRRP